MRTVTYTQILRETLADALRRDPRVFLMGEDIGTYGGAFGVTRGLLQEFGPERVRDTPISEPAFVGAAIGAAAAGSRPVVEIMFMDFIALAADQLINMAAKLRYVYGVSCPLVASHTFTVLSSVAVASRCPSGLNAMLQTQLVGPFNVSVS